MTQYDPVVVEREDNGTCSVHLQALSELGREPRPQGEVVVLRYDERASTRRVRLRFVGVGVGALLGRTTTAAKAAAARRNGRKGGRPRTV